MSAKPPAPSAPTLGPPPSYSGHAPAPEAEPPASGRQPRSAPPPIPAGRLTEPYDELSRREVQALAKFRHLKANAASGSIIADVRSLDETRERCYGHIKQAGTVPRSHFRATDEGSDAFVTQFVCAFAARRLTENPGRIGPVLCILISIICVMGIILYAGCAADD